MSEAQPPPPAAGTHAHMPSGHPHPHPPAGAAGAGAAAEAKAGSSVVAGAKTNLKYLALGNKAGVRPNSVATRGLLSTARYVIRYIFYRLLRVGKYAVIGAAIAGLGTAALGIGGAAVSWFLIPSTSMGLTMGMLWGVAKFGWRHRPDRFRGGWWDEMSTRASQGRDASTDEKNDAEIAEAAELERHRRMNRMGGDIWMAA